MKRYLKYVLLFLMVLSLSGISAAAEEAQFKTEWYGDYATMELVIKVQPSAKYCCFIPCRCKQSVFR